MAEAKKLTGSERARTMELVAASLPRPCARCRRYVYRGEPWVLAERPGGRHPANLAIRHAACP